MILLLSDHHKNRRPADARAHVPEFLVAAADPLLAKLGWSAGAAERVAMTWNLALTWFIMPTVVALIVGLGGVWLAKHTP